MDGAVAGGVEGDLGARRLHCAAAVLHRLLDQRLHARLGHDPERKQRRQRELSNVLES